jgi:hypothetical protein
MRAVFSTANEIYSEAVRIRLLNIEREFSIALCFLSPLDSDPTAHLTCVLVTELLVISQEWEWPIVLFSMIDYGSSVRELE